MDYNIHVSEGNSKMGKIASFSLTPLMTCRSDAPCKKKCYALKAYRRFKLTRHAYDENTILTQRNRDRFENQMNAWIEEHKPSAFRIHVAGDFYSYEYLMAWMRIARRHKSTRFFCFTKQWDAVRKYMKSNHLLPNFTIIASAWLAEGDAKEWCPPDDLLAVLPAAWVIDEKKDVDEQYRKIADVIGEKRVGLIRKCKGKCDECGMCFHTRKMDGDILLHLH